MPSTIAPGVFIISWRGSPIAEITAFITPWRSRSTCHAIVRSRKFIHIGRIITKIRKPCLPYLLSLRIIAIGNAMIRHITVLITASKSDRPSACK